MPDQPVPAATSACQYIKTDSTQCRRRTSGHEKFCWQHAKGIPNRLRSLTRNQTVSFLLVLLFGVVGSIPEVSSVINRFQRPTIGVSLALITTVHRMHDKTGGFMKGGSNDLIAVARIRQHNGLAARHVASLQVVGDVEADCNSYISSFFDLHGQYHENDLDAECTKQKPFFNLSWISFPMGPTRIDQDDEEFIRFTISDSFGQTSFLGNPRDYFGFEATKTRPKYPLTAPVWSLLVRFTGVNPTDFTGRGPVVRDEVKSGKIKIQINLDDEIVDIPISKIKVPWSASLPDYMPDTMLPQDLFYAIDNGERAFQAKRTL